MLIHEIPEADVGRSVELQASHLPHHVRYRIGITCVILLVGLGIGFSIDQKEQLETIGVLRASRGILLVTLAMLAPC